MNTVAIIPARGGSKRIPNKNLLPFNGEPLLAHTIRHALNSKLIDRVLVSSDDDYIGKIATLSGAEYLKRPASISGDNSSSEDAILHALNFINESKCTSVDTIVFLQCTSPNRRLSDIDNAIIKYREGNYDSLISVQETYALLWRKSNDSISPLNYNPENRLPEQHRSPDLIENGSIFVFDAKKFLIHKNRIFGKVGAYKMDEFTSWQIDREDDVVICEEFSRHI